MTTTTPKTFDVPALRREFRELSSDLEKFLWWEKMLQESLVPMTAKLIILSKDMDSDPDFDWGSLGDREFLLSDRTTNEERAAYVRGCLASIRTVLGILSEQTGYLPAELEEAIHDRVEQRRRFNNGSA